MRRILWLLLCLPLVASAAQVHLRPYGIATIIPFVLYNSADGTVDTDETDGGTEVSLSCDGAAFATATNDFSNLTNGGYSIVLTTTEMLCSIVYISVAASGGTEVILVETYGHPSSRHPRIGR